MELLKRPILDFGFRNVDSNSTINLTIELLKRPNLDFAYFFYGSNRQISPRAVEWCINRLKRSKPRLILTTRKLGPIGPLGKGGREGP